MTHPGVGPLTALAYVLVIGTPERFRCGKQLGSYVGMIPSEDSSADKQRLGHISKQGNSLLRFLLVEAAQAAARINEEWRRRYVRLAVRRHRSIAKVAMGRRMNRKDKGQNDGDCEHEFHGITSLPHKNALHKGTGERVTQQEMRVSTTCLARRFVVVRRQSPVSCVTVHVRLCR